jgi:hypothetical protein
MKYSNCNLGDADVDTIIANVMASARALFPQQTAEAEAWIASRLTSYGIDYAKYRAQQLYGGVNEWLSNPVVLLGVGLLGGYLLFRK